MFLMRSTLYRAMVCGPFIILFLTFLWWGRPLDSLSRSVRDLISWCFVVSFLIALVAAVFAMARPFKYATLFTRARPLGRIAASWIRWGGSQAVLDEAKAWAKTGIHRFTRST